MFQPMVSIICVNLNGRDHLESLLASIQEQDYPRDRLEIIIVDNGSSDGSVEFLQIHHPDVRLLRNERNEGFARPNNQAAEIAKGQYLALLNNDMKLEPDWVSRMVGRLEGETPDTVCVASRILNWDGSLVDFIGGSIAFNGMGFQTAFRVPVDSPEGTKFPTEIPFACGGAMLIEREAFLEARGFDEDFFAYFEDVDLGWRLWVMGYRTVFCPEAVVFHRHNGTSSRFDWWKKITLFERNALCAVFKNYDDENLGKILPVSLLLGFKRMAVRSGIARADYRFDQGTAPVAAPQMPPSESLLSRVLRELRHHGPKHTVKLILLNLAKRIMERWGGRPIDLSVRTVPLNREAYASVVGMEDFIDLMPRLFEKRAYIQARRRRSDADIFRILGTPMHSVEPTDDYLKAHWGLLEAFGIKATIEQAQLQSPVGKG